MFGKRGRLAVTACGAALLCLVGMSLDRSVRAQDSTPWWAQYGGLDVCQGDPVTLNRVRDRVLKNDPNWKDVCAVSNRDGRPNVQIFVHGDPGAANVRIIAYVNIEPNVPPPAWWESVSCSGSDRLANDLLRRLGITLSAKNAECLFSDTKVRGVVTSRRIDITFPVTSLAAPAPAATCAKSSLLGPWKNASTRYADKGGAGLTFERSARPGEFLGRFKLGASARDAELTFGGAIETSGPAKGCLFPANVGSSQRLEEAIKFNPEVDTFTIVDAQGAPHPRYPGRWTRGAPAKPVASCGKDAINGTWHRADGAIVKMAGVETLASGGHAIVERFPEDRWPKGRVKFSVVKKAAECRYTARCATVDAKRVDGRYSYDVREADCTLTVDPVKRTLTASGTHGVYRREAYPQAGEAAKPSVPPKPVADDEADRAAALNREIAERDAAIKRRNAEAEAADVRRKAEYAAAVKRREAEIARIKREEAEAKRRYEQQMADWRARVAACEAGDRTKCATP